MKSKTATPKKDTPAKTLKFDKDGVVDTNKYYDKEEPFDSKQFEKNLTITAQRKTQDTLEFDIKGIDASIANALRRILIAEIPTMAFHKVFLYQNTSVIPDEVLVHRLGLMPIKVDAKNFALRNEDDPLDANNSLKFELRVACSKKEEYKKYSDEELESKGIKPEEYLHNAEVFAHQFKWIPQGNQQQLYPMGVGLVYPDIPVVKLRENQEIFLEIYAQKGIGRKHAKWSPVSTAFYRLAPKLSILPSFNQAKHSRNLVQSCPMNVFDIEDEKAYVANERNCSTCRECIKYEGVSLEKYKDHFIFTIESTGIYCPSELFQMALDVFEEKVKSYIV